MAIPRLHLQISDQAFAYLKLQKGRLEPLSGNRRTWERAYEEAIWADFQNLIPVIPRDCRRVLDVGGGLGGIDILIHRDTGARVTILDGLDDPPRMTFHRQTFSSRAVALDFLGVNGVLGAAYVGPQELAKVEGPLDLVLSLGAWCFHVPPSEYLDQVVALCRKGAVIVVDLRANKPEWAEELAAALEFQGVVRLSPKFTRSVYRVP